VRAVGEYSWLLEFDDGDERKANERARRAAALLHGLKPDGLVEAIPAARTLFVEGSPLFEAGILVGLEAGEIEVPPSPVASHEIHVRFDGEDLPAVSAVSGVSKEELLETFCAATYTVGFLGFSPGFAYLYGLPRRLHLPRRGTPRLSVPAGSVAIAGPYAGIYPASMPGGWHLLGVADAPLFDAGRTPPVHFAPGDTVRFVP